MRVFYAAHESCTGDGKSRTWYNNLYLPICDLGHDVERFDHDLSGVAKHQDMTKEENLEYIEEHRPRVSEELVKQVKDAHNKKGIDVLFTYFASAFCEPGAIEEIGKMGITTINWFCNASYQFHLVKDIAPAYHCCLVPERFRLQDYKDAGARPVYCQEAANPNVYQRKELPEDLDVSFVGGRYGNRLSIINSLYDKGLDVKVYGKNWQGGHINENKFKKSLRAVYDRIKGRKYAPPEQFHPAVEDAEMVNIFNRSAINLGFSTCGDTFLENEPIKQVRLRDFEVTMCGGFYLVEENDELADFFEPGKEIVFFSDAEDCADKAIFYLKRANLRKIISEAAFKRARSEHTWQQRLQKVFSELKIG